MTSQPAPIVPSRPRRAPAPVARPTLLQIAALSLVFLLALVAAASVPARAQDQGTQSASAASAQGENGRGAGMQPTAPEQAAAPAQEMESQMPVEEASAAEETQPAEPPAIDTAPAVFAADQALAQAVENGDQKTFAAMIADDAIFLSAQGALEGHDAIVSGWSSLLAKDRTATLTWDPEGARVASSRELGYSLGSYTLTVQRPEGEPIQSQGRYISVWTRDVAAGGPWKVLFDGPLRRGYAAYLERALGEQGQTGPKIGVDLAFVPERLVTAQSDDFSVTYGSYQAQRIDLDGTEHPLADGAWFSVWVTSPEATPDEATRLLPAGDSVTPPPPVAAETPAAADDEAIPDNEGPADGGMGEG